MKKAGGRGLAPEAAASAAGPAGGALGMGEGGARAA